MRNMLNQLNTIIRLSLVIIFSLASATVSAASLTDSVQLRLYPGDGYPIVIELPRNSEIKILQRQNDWLMVGDSRNQKGWVAVDELRLAGGVDPVLRWGWRELEDDLGVDLRFGLDSNPHNLAWSMAGFYKISGLDVGVEYGQGYEGEAGMQNLMLWLEDRYMLNATAFLRYALGAGMGAESKQGQRFTEIGKSSQLALLGLDLSIGVNLTSRLSTDLGVRWLASDQQDSEVEPAISWKWQFGI